MTGSRLTLAGQEFRKDEDNEDDEDMKALWKGSPVVLSLDVEIQMELDFQNLFSFTLRPRNLSQNNGVKFRYDTKTNMKQNTQ